MQDQEYKIISYNDKIDVFIWLLNTNILFESLLIVYTH